MSHQKEIQEMYTNKVNLYQWFFLKVLRYEKALENFFAIEVHLQSGMKILDAGCGTGLLTKILHKESEKQGQQHVVFHAFDITAAMLKVFTTWIKSIKASNMSIRQEDVLDLNSLPNSWNEYDLVVTSAMLEHLPKQEIESAMSNLVGLLKSGGKILIFITRKNLLMKYLIGKLWKANMYSSEELSVIMNKVGLKEVRFKRFAFPYFYINSWGIVIEAVK